MHLELPHTSCVSPNTILDAENLHVSPDLHNIHKSATVLQPATSEVNDHDYYPSVRELVCTVCGY